MLACLDLRQVTCRMHAALKKYAFAQPISCKLKWSWLSSALYTRSVCTQVLSQPIGHPVVLHAFITRLLLLTSLSRSTTSLSRLSWLLRMPGWWPWRQTFSLLRTFWTVKVQAWAQCMIIHLILGRSVPMCRKSLTWLRSTRTTHTKSADWSLLNC